MLATADPRTDTSVIEWAPFRLQPGVDEATLLRASDALQTSFLEKQPGFVRRELLKGNDGAWADLVVWADQQSADAVMKSAFESPICLEYFKLMIGADPADPGAGVLHFQRLRTYSTR